MAGNKLSGLVSTASPAPRIPKDERDRMRRYEAEDALRTITRAAEIQRDRKLMSEVKKVAREQVKTLQCVTGRKK